MRQFRVKGKRVNVFLAVILSTVLHLLFVGGLEKFSASHIQKKDVVTIDIISPEKNEAKQVVEQNSKPINNETPTEDYFLGAHNQRVVKQTKAKNQGSFNNSEAQKKPSTQKSPAQKKPSWRRLASNYDISGRAQRKQEESQDQRRNRRNLANLDKSQTNDFLKGVKEGQETLLSTREFIYYSYFSRIRKQLRRHWEKNIQKKVSDLYRSGRRIASARNHKTRILVILNNEGQLLNIKVLGASGTYDLDAAAINAFRSAAPFPNPPKGIADSRGEIKIPWEFVIET